MTLMTLMTSNQSHQGNQWFKLYQLIEFQTPINFLLRYVCLMFDWFLKFVGIFGVVFATAANAEDKDPFDITFYGSFLHTGTVPNALFFFNDIEQYDSFELRRAIRNHDIDIVVLASDGGSVWEGLNMAGIIHDKGIATYVPELPEKLGCYSACSFMFFGGKIRKADGILAVHQAGAYGSERDKASAKVSETQQNTQFTVSEIIGFLNEFETPPWVFEKMFRSREFYFFDEDEKDRLAARTEEISPENLYSINAFVSSFMKYLDDLANEEKKDEKQPDNTGDTSSPIVVQTEEEKEPEISEEEQLRLAIIEIQKLLNAAGCNAGIADGIWGRRTQAAAVLFAKTAKLPTSKASLISDEFLNKLRVAPANFCPKPKKKASVRILAGKWSVKTVCSGNRVINGAGYSTFAQQQGNSEIYSVSYRNEFGDTGAGTLTYSKGSKSAGVRLKLRGKWYYYALIKINNSKWQGRYGSDCKITFSR